MIRTRKHDFGLFETLHHTILFGYYDKDLMPPRAFVSASTPIALSFGVQI
jgi:hypothetical protein